MGDRYTSNTQEPTLLNFKFLKDGKVFDPVSVNRVDIYSNYADAASNSNASLVITSSGISRVDTGLFEYNVPIISTPGLYYDKIFITPTITDSEIGFINSFSVGTIVWSGTVAAPLCKIYGTLMASGKPLGSVRIKFIPDDNPAVDSFTNSGAVPIPEVAVTNAEGYFEAFLVKTLVYRVVIKSMALYTKILVPNEQASLLWSLTSVPIVGDPVVDSPVSGTNW